jgi:hypothetical protein
LKIPHGRVCLAVLTVAAFLLVPAYPTKADEPPVRPDAAKLRALFDEEWQWTLREYPEFATAVGDSRYNDKQAQA